MRKMGNVNSGYGQFRWVVLLLAVAVILPTVCLLWFMNEVVKSERLVVRQKLTTFYKAQLAEVTGKVNDKWAESGRHLERRPSLSPYRQFAAAAGQNDYDGLIIYDDTGRRLYPVLSTDVATLPRPSEQFADAWEMEFVRQEYEQAAERYEQYANISDEQGRLAAYISKSRALAKLGDLDRAVAECRRWAAFSPLAETGDSRCLVLIANARLLLLSWIQGNPTYTQLYEETFRKLLALLYNANGAGYALPADQNLFVARRVLELGRVTGLLEKNADLLRGTTLERLIAAEECSILFAEQFPTLSAFDGWDADKLQPLRLGDASFYGIVHRTGRGTCAGLVSNANLILALADYADSFQDANVEYRIIDDTGRLIAGAGETAREPLAAGPLGSYFPDWTIHLFFRDNDVLKRAADEQVAVYTWTGVLFILIILASGTVAARSIGNQVRLNKLKNDFIATVTHELKTPLASMRVLVDTLLEGNYRDQQQVTEYLQLVAKENERLSRLIDNFLTFSRMERNKQAFQMRPASPVSIARTAAQAARTKLSQGHCLFETDIPDELPAIHADHDAMVTVLVNLLDNAYKYSGDEKRIKLSVARDAAGISFRVSDNGVGIPRRSLRKIFRRFYQVDRSLSRRAEGCGLGLSIAKFILDAHQGTITVDSKPGQGSTFTVTLPATPAV
jgi:signal transduction histidine kinase